MTHSFIVNFVNAYTEQDIDCIQPDWSATADLNQEFRHHAIDHVVQSKLVTPILARDLLDSESDYCACIFGSTPQLRMRGDTYFELTEGMYAHEYDNCRAKSFDCESALQPVVKKDKE